MAIEKLTKNVEIIQTLSDYPNTDSGLTPAQLKEKFDEGNRIIKEYLNETVVPAINDPHPDGLPMEFKPITSVSSMNYSKGDQDTDITAQPGRAQEGRYLEHKGYEGEPIILRGIAAGTQQTDAVNKAQLDKAVLHTEQELTPEQKSQARKNIGAISSEDIPAGMLEVEISDDGKNASHNATEIYEHIQSGGAAVACYLGMYYQLTRSVEGCAEFCSFDKEQDGITGVLVWSDGTAEYYSRDIVSTDYYASYDRAGLVRIPGYSSGGYGLKQTDQTSIPGGLVVACANENDIYRKTSTFKPIVPAHLDYAVYIGLLSNPYTFSVTQQKRNCKWIGTLHVVENDDGTLTVTLPSGKTRTVDLSLIEKLL